MTVYEVMKEVIDVVINVVKTWYLLQGYIHCRDSSGYGGV